MKKILGLDIGTNSIGWSLIVKNDETHKGKILGMGSRIISLGEDKTNFEQGKALSRNANRRVKRGLRKLNKRYKQRRNKLIYTLYQLELLPDRQFEFDVPPEFMGEDGIFPKPEKLQQLSLIPKRNTQKHTFKWKQLSAIELNELKYQAIYGEKPIDEKDFGRLIYLYNQLRGYSGGDLDDTSTKSPNKTEAVEKVDDEKILREYKTVKIEEDIEKVYKTREKKVKGKILQIPVYTIEAEDTITRKKYKGDCYRSLDQGSIHNLQVISKNSEAEFVFFNVDGTEWKEAKPRKGGIEFDIQAKIITCERMQKYSGRKWYYQLTVSDENRNTMAGELGLPKTEMAVDFKKDAERELLVITSTENGETIYEFSLPQKSNWRKRMEELNKRKQDAERKEERKVYLCELFLEDLRKNKWERIRNQVILRKHYQEEFDAIWHHQMELNHELRRRIENPELLNKILNYIFPANPNGNKPESRKEEYKNEASKPGNGLRYVIRDQIIYYQRPLKPQFRLIGQCQFEEGLKVVPQSHPLHQEEKIWKGINSLSVVRFHEVNGKKRGREESIPVDIKEKLFEELIEKPNQTYSQVRSKLNLKETDEWLKGLNPRAKLKGHETRIAIKKILGDELFAKAGLDNTAELIAFWRILFNWVREEFDEVPININDYESNPAHYHIYSPNSDNEYDIESGRCKSIHKFFSDKKINLSDEQILEIAKIRFKRTYSSLSAKALKKIIPLVKAGKYFSESKGEIANEAKENLLLLKDNAGDMLQNIEEGVDTGYDKAFLEKILKGELDHVFEKGEMIFSDAVSLFYKKHTAINYTKDHPDFIRDYHDIKTFWLRKQKNPDEQKNHLRNPVVEQITDEVLQLVKSIWKEYQFKPDEVHVELARDLKNNAEERKQIWEAVLAGEKENNWVRKRLRELKKTLPPENTIEIEGNEPSLGNIEKYKLWKKQIRKKDEPDKNKSGIEPDRQDVEKYRLWSEQLHISPYTHKPISLSRLFSKDYDIDHIIPKARYFDDSLSNKVVCESIVNRDKSNRTPYEYLNASPSVEGVVDWNTYVNWVNDIFKGQKKKYLLMEEIPDDFVNRQLKETQYVTVKVKEELGKIFETKNVKVTTGGITDYLKSKWGLNDKFKKATEDRYRLMQLMAEEDDWIENKWDKERRKNIYKIKLWSKRNDHRHHALDALVVACTTQSHVQQLNNLNKNLQSWFSEFDIWYNEKKIAELITSNYKDQKDVLIALSKIDLDRRMEIARGIYDSLKEKQKRKERATGEMSSWFGAFNSLEDEYREEIIKSMPGFRSIEVPWKDFYSNENLEKWIEHIVVSHKPNPKLLIQERQLSNGGKKDYLRIRGRLHEETYYGKDETYRLNLEKLAGKNKLEAFIKSKVVSEKLKSQLLKHLMETYEGDKKKAFSGEGLKVFNDERIKKGLKPVNGIKVRYAKDSNNEDEGKLEILSKPGYDLGSIAVKTGANYCFAVVEKETKGMVQRVFGEISFFEATKRIKEAMKQGKKDISQLMKEYFENDCDQTKGGKLLFTLTQNDLVYLPENEIPLKPQDSNFENYWGKNKLFDRKRIYRVVKFTGGTCFFVPHTLSQSLTYTSPAPIENEDHKQEHTEHKSEEKKEKHEPFYEFGSYKDCSPYIFDEHKIVDLKKGQEKRSSKKKLKEQIQTLLDSTNESTDEQIVDILLRNPNQGLITELKKLNAAKHDQIKALIKQHKQDEIDNLLSVINSKTGEEQIAEAEGKLFNLMKDFAKEYSLKRYLNKKDKTTASKIVNLIKSATNDPGNIESTAGIKIQDFCIKLQVDRLGNIKPA